MDLERCEPDDEELLRELAAVLSTVPVGDGGLTVQDVAAAGRACFAWRSVCAEVEALLPGAVTAAPAGGVSAHEPPAHVRRLRASGCGARRHACGGSRQSP